MRKALHLCVCGSRQFFVRVLPTLCGWHIYCHPQTDCFVVSQLFSMARHAIFSKLESKPETLIHPNALPFASGNRYFLCPRAKHHGVGEAFVYGRKHLGRKHRTIPLPSKSRHKKNNKETWKNKIKNNSVPSSWSIYVRIHTHTHTQARAHTYIYIYVCVCVNVFVCVFVCVCVCSWPTVFHLSMFD